MDAKLSALIDGGLHTLAAGSNDISTAALRAAKCVFDLAIQSESDAKPHVDKLLASLGPAEAPKTRAQARKRKRTPSPAPLPVFQTTPLAALYTDGMDEDQIWSQLDLRSKQLCDMLDHVLDGELPNDEDDEAEGAEGMDLDDEDELDEIDAEDVVFDEEEDDDDDEEEDDEDEAESSSMGSLAERVQELRDESDGEDEETDALSLLERMDKRPARPPARRKRGHAELDDGFFDLAAFNAETEEAEARQVSRGRLNDDDSDDDDNISVDLFAPVDDSQAFDEADEEETELYYKDFFEAPPKKPAAKGKGKGTSPKKAGGVRFNDEVRVKSIKAQGKGLPVNFNPQVVDDEDEDDDFDEEDAVLDEDDASDEEDEDASDDDEDTEDDESDAESELAGLQGRETIDRLKDDLFADGEEDEEDDADMTAHERRMAALREQINELEQENVGAKDWTLMGEVDTRRRPQNSLLEEDLEFERLSKAIPVETEETIQSLEARIKARVLANDFNDVVRIRPTDDKPFLPSRFFELKDTKSAQGLAEIYEDEYVAAQSGVGTDDRDGKLKKEHDELDKMWEGICYKLDALSNAHFTPKQPKATISTISNVPVATLESALPTAASASTMLAPEEVHAPKASDLRARSELTPAEKRALHNKDRKTKRRMRDTLDKSVDKFARMKSAKGARRQKEEALRSVVKSGKGVTVVGKKNKELMEKKGRKGKPA